MERFAEIGVQDGVTKKNLQSEVQDTTKAAALESDNECPKIVALEFMKLSQ